VLRISASSQDGGVWLRLHGSLSGPWVGQLQEEVVRALTQSKVVTLDLQEVSYVDLTGVAMLRSFPSQVIPVNCSPFLREQLAS
jgi:ABC-type transporter Mla MlaB component